MVAAMIGDWTTAVSRKERKNRGKRDDASRHERATSFGDVPPHTMETQNCTASPGSNKSKNKVHVVEIIAQVTVFFIYHRLLCQRQHIKYIIHDITY